MISTPTQPCHNSWWAWVNTWKHWEESGLHKRLCYSVLHWADESVVHWWRGVSESLCPVCMDTHHKGLTKPPWSHALGLSTWLWWPCLCHPKVIHHPKQWLSLPSGSVIQYFWKVIHQLRKVNWPLDPKDDVMGWSFILFEKWSQNHPFSRLPFRTLEIRHSPLEILYFIIYRHSLFTKRCLLSREKPCKNRFS